MDSGDHLRLAEYQQVIVAFQVAGPVGKAPRGNLLHVDDSSGSWCPYRRPAPEYVHLTAHAVVQLCCSHSLPTTLHVTSHTGTKRAGGKENNGQHETCSACHPLLFCRMAAQAPYPAYKLLWRLPKRRPDKRSAIEHPVMSLIRSVQELLHYN